MRQDANRNLRHEELRLVKLIERKDSDLKIGEFVHHGDIFGKDGVGMPQETSVINEISNSTQNWCSQDGQIFICRAWDNLTPGVRVSVRMQRARSTEAIR